MMERSIIAAWAALVLAMDAGASEIRSDAIPVNTSPGHNRCWSTVFTNEIDLTWEWTADTTRVQLEIVGMNGAFTTNFTEVTSTYRWRVFAPGVPPAEDVYDLTLTRYGNGGAVAGVLTSRLAVVKGAFGQAFVDPVPSSGTWSKISSNVVIPYDAAWTNASAGASSAWLTLSNGGTAQTNTLSDAGGYFGWKLRGGGWGYGTFDLSLAFPGTVWEWYAELIRFPDGTIVGVR